MSKLRLIKKHKNRRLYDTSAGSYINLEDIKSFVVEKFPIRVIEASTGNDLTFKVLLQIFTELEEREPSIFSINHLQHLIRKKALMKSGYKRE